MNPTSSPTFLPDEYLPYLDELNRIVIASGVPLEGGLFYYHNETMPGRRNVLTPFTIKRRNFAAACRASNRVLEIGLNAGHSALLALACGIEYHGVDICQYAYTRPAADFLKSVFGERFHFYIGDSLKVVPQLAQQRPDLRFDMLHIDGHHGEYYCRHDTINALAMSDSKTWLLIDDTDLKPIAAFYQEMVETHHLVEEVPEGWEEFYRHRIGRMYWPGKEQAPT